MTPEPLDYIAEPDIEELSADRRVLKIMVQALVWNFIGGDADPLDVLYHLKNEVMTAVFKTMAVPPEGQGGEEADRQRRATLVRAERMFREIEQIMVAEHQNLRRVSGGGDSH